MIRNAARHASTDRSTPALRVATQSHGDRWQIDIEDNGSGFEDIAQQIESGHGLSIHSTMMAVIGGELRIENGLGDCTRVELWFST